MVGSEDVIVLQPEASSKAYLRSYIDFSFKYFRKYNLELYPSLSIWRLFVFSEFPGSLSTYY